MVVRLSRRGTITLPKEVRGRLEEGTPLSFAGPDGRATFEILWDAGEPVLRWRRIGDHRIFRAP